MNSPHNSIRKYEINVKFIDNFLIVRMKKEKEKRNEIGIIIEMFESKSNRFQKIPLGQPYRGRLPFLVEESNPS